MASKNLDEQVDINFESHPPIEDDIIGITALLRQTLLQFVDCNGLARHLIDRKELTQVIAQEEPDEENASEDDEPDDDIYGVCSLVELPIEDKSTDAEYKRQLLKLFKEKCSKFKDLVEDTQHKDQYKIGLIINERYINLPPQLSLPTLKTLTESLSGDKFTHLIFISKILLRSRNTNTKLPSKKSKTGQSSASEADPIIFVNPEEEIISEEAEFFSDLDVSAHCDENASWSAGSDIKYIPHRRFIVVNAKNWPDILKKLEKELTQ